MSKRITAGNVKLKRAYEPSAADDGTRILIDRLWPRGVKKADAAIDEWIKDIAPSTALRKWFGHDPARWPEFRSRYAVEVHAHPEQLSRLRALARQGQITLVYSAHDEVHNDAVALRDFLLGRLFMMFIIRAGIQILADHPRLYWSRDCTPGTEWFRFQHPVPEGRIWTSKDDSVTLPGWLGIPGIRHSIGLARWWHFSILLLWTINGVAFYVLLFATDQWRRLVHLTWGVFPNALSTAIQYASLNFPVDHSWTRYNGLQQLSYFITVFIAAPVSIATGLMQSPAISNKVGLLGTVLNRQAARSIHFISFSWFVLFILAHGIMVFVTGLRQNTNHMFFGVKNNTWSGLPLFVLAMAVVGWAWWVASPFTIRHARLVQRTGRLMVGWIKGLSEWWEPNAQLTEKDISPHFWPNGTMPNSAEFEALVAEQFDHYRLRVGGLVEAPREFSFSDLKALPKQEQITTHFCIQGWSGVAKWGGVPMRDILDIVKPTADARYAVFYSFSEGAAGGGYYDVHEIDNMRHRLTILAYEMNGAPVSVLHGAPLRLRCENELGFKMVKWIAAIEFVHDFADLGAGQGGYNEDHEFYGYRMPI